jgi:lysophospholipase L1-like esterase
MRVALMAAGLAAVFVLLAVQLRWSARRPALAAGSSAHLVLIGASIGRDWDLADWPARAGEPSITAETLAVWQFDKTEAVEEVLLRPARRFRFTRTYLRSLLAPPPRAPDAVILKECSAYFPGDLARYQAQFSSWVEALRRRGVTPIVATVVPVTPARDARTPGKQRALRQFNRWLRELASQQALPLLDLERALGDGTPDNYLAARFAEADGTHVNRDGYAVLDRALWRTLQEAGILTSSREAAR